METTVINEMFNINNKNILIIGGAGGIGRGLALALVKCGANIIIGDIKYSKALTVKREIEDLNKTCLAFKVDVVNLNSVLQMVESILKKVNKIDVLIYCTGINIRKSALEMSEDDWEKVIDTNLKGAFFCNKVVGKTMIKQGGGKIINIASVAAERGHPNMVAYTASKGGLVLLTKSLAVEWAKYNVNVNAVGPGYIETPLTKELLLNKKVYNNIIEKIPMKRLAKIDDLIGAILLLSSDASNYITGHVLFIDGGKLAD